MSNLDRDPGLLLVEEDAPPARRIDVLTPRDVPLGGPRAMTVRRTLPQRERSLIGAWCFVDHYGPDDVSLSGGMRVDGHPHTSLQTVTWMFEGEVEHRDTLGTVLTIRPGEVNLMTSGSGIAHSEYSTPSTTRLHGAQLWIALPEDQRSGQRTFQNYAAPQVRIGDADVRVFLGDLADQRSPVHTWTPTLGAEIVLPPHSRLELEVDPTFEHGVLVDAGPVWVDGELGEPAHLLYRAPLAAPLAFETRESGARLLLIGGEPLGESIVMWWNFIGRSHEEIVSFRDDWQAEVARHAAATSAAIQTGDAEAFPTEGFGEFPSTWTRVLPAPELPSVRLRARR
ncbi:pirin family protein [Naasia lichenicola]|uniref:Pirin family protein n=1 Tax=Naasia lichenicola TaxID=2565933 RepID=A0A4S4FUV0_9MICO|nr:pirin family protein [Naasia lichenicola]THG33396.1 pirin family protein [Naasia lichenicola]